MAPQSSDAADALFWKAYGAAIQKAVGNVTANDTTAFYLSTKSQRGPPGGNNIAPSFTNEGIYNFGNNLLPPDQLFYSPSTQNSYIDQLATYLAWVNAGGNPTDANIQQVTNTWVAMNAADEGQSNALKKALSEFKDQKEAGLVGDQTFAQWAPSNAFQYTQAVTSYAAKSAAYQKAYKNAYGPLAATIMSDAAKLQKALDSVSSNPGFNMQCGLGTPPSAPEINNAVTAGKALTDPNTVLRPAYECPSYISVIKNAQSLVGSNQPTKNSFTITSSQGSKVSESNFNKTAVSGGVSFDYCPWVSFSARASSEDQTESLSTDSFAQQIRITVTYDDISLVPINPSPSWDLGDVRTKYQKLLPGAPTSVKTLVKPSMLVLATRLGYTVDVGAQGRTTFDKMTKSVKSGGGSVSILGIPCSFGADASTSSETTTHRATWDETNNTFTVEPTDNCGFATIVGLIGEKIVTA